VVQQSWENEQPAPLSAREVLFVLFGYQRVILSVTVTVVLGLVIGLYFWSDSYEARASILVKMGRQNMTMTSVLPPSSPQQILSSGVRKEELNTEIEILQNRSFIEKVVDTIGPAFFFPEPVPPANILKRIKFEVRRGIRFCRETLDEVLYALDLKRQLSQRDRAILAVEKALSAKVVKDSDVVEVLLRSDTPEGAEYILKTIIATYLERHVEAHRVGEAPSFLAKQVETIAERLQDSEEQLEQLKKKKRITSFGDQQRSLLAEVTRNKSALRNTETEIAETLTKLEQVRDQMKSQLEYVEITKDQSRNAAIDTLKQRLLDLELERMKLDMKFEPTSRPIVELNNQIAEVKAKLSQEGGSVVGHITTGLNTVHQGMQKEILQLEVSLNSLRVKKEAIAKHLATYTQELDQLQSYDMELVRLGRQIKLDEESYQLYKRKLEESRIGEMLDSDKVVNVRVVEPATASPVPTMGGRKGLILGVGSLLGFLTGIALAFILDTLDHSLRTAEHVQRWLGLQVFASIEEAKT
jgi:uncharacterized protein involved in exopolysaccharide biosynthesis